MAISNYRMDNLPRSIQILIFTVLVICLALGFYVYYLKDLIQEHASIQAEISRLEVSVQRATAIETQLNQFKQELIQLEAHLAELQSILLAEKETPEFLRSVQQMATSSNLKINKFQPKALIHREFYSDWPIEIEVEGNYNGLGLFFEKVSRSPRIIDAGTISIKGNDKTTDPRWTLTASCTATTFISKEDQLVKPNEKETKR
jgi:type IV pilus assembly protein PilO